jgi:hypothetical protein
LDSSFNNFIINWPFLSSKKYEDFNFFVKGSHPKPVPLEAKVSIGFDKQTGTKIKFPFNDSKSRPFLFPDLAMVPGRYSLFLFLFVYNNAMKTSPTLKRKRME